MNISPEGDLLAADDAAMPLSDKQKNDLDVVFSGLMVEFGIIPFEQSQPDPLAAGGVPSLAPEAPGSAAPDETAATDPRPPVGGAGGAGDVGPGE